jgi:hypothetical protein
MTDVKEEDVRKELERQLSQARTKAASEEQSQTQAQAQPQETLSVEADEEFLSLYNEKVAQGVVAPPDDAPEEVKQDFASKLEEERKARWEEHRKVQNEATQQWFDSQPPQVKKRIEAQKAIFAQNEQE